MPTRQRSNGALKDPDAEKWSALFAPLVANAADPPSSGDAGQTTGISIPDLFGEDFQDRSLQCRRVDVPSKSLNHQLAHFLAGTVVGHFGG